MRPTKPRVRGTRIRKEDQGAFVSASVRAIRMLIREGMRIRLPIQSIRFSFSARVDSLV